MDVRIQQRLVGGLVILALIFLIAPVVLDGEGRLPEKITQIPPKPKRPDLSHLQIEPVTDSTVEVAALPDEPPLPAVSVVEPEAEARPTPAEAPSAEAADEPAPQPEQPSVAVAPGERAWSVQVASFRDSAKAAALRDQLRDQGFQTYVNEVILSDGTLFTQVLVGPETDIDSVQALKAEIKQKVELQGLVVRYEP